MLLDPWRLQSSAIRWSLLQVWATGRRCHQSRRESTLRRRGSGRERNSMMQELLLRQRSVTDWGFYISSDGKKDELKRKCIKMPILCRRSILFWWNGHYCDPALQILEMSGGDLINPIHYWVTTTFACFCLFAIIWGVHLISKLYSELFRAECRQMSLGRDFAGIENRLATDWCNLQNICRNNIQLWSKWYYSGPKIFQFHIQG